MRVIFALLCLIGGASAGLIRSAALKKRERLLSEVVGLLEKMSAQIRYNASPLGDLFGTLSKDGGEFINTVGACHGTDGQINWRTAWNAAVSGFSEFNDGDKELLLTVGNSLGSSDTAGQVNMLGLHRELLTVRCGEAAETAANKGAVYRSVGLLTGLGMAIMVI